MGEACTWGLHIDEISGQSPSVWFECKVFSLLLPVLVAFFFIKVTTIIGVARTSKIFTPRYNLYVMSIFMYMS